MLFKPSEKSRAGYYFLAFVLALYGLTYYFKSESFFPALEFAKQIVIKIAPVFVLIFILLVLVSYFVKPKQLVKHLGRESGAKGWLLAVVAGILSTGPIYMWYPLLSELKEHGMRNGLIATFLYNRAVKPALIPLMIVYFSWQFVIILTAVMIIASIANGWVVEQIVETFNNE